MKRINKNIETLGFSETFYRIMKYTSRKVIFNRTEETLHALANQAVLLITNHPAETDAMLLLSSIPQREDAYIVINHFFIGMLPAFNKHCIPVYVNYRLNNTYRSRFLAELNPVNYVSEEESKILNRNSIALTAMKIDEGGIVLFAPGFGNKDKKFKTGLGHLLNKIQKPEAVKIVMTYISGTSKYDYFRAIPFIGKLFPSYQVDFSLPMNAKEFISGDPYQDTIKMQEKYFSWADSI